jgi:Uma2 family endonuclease
MTNLAEQYITFAEYLAVEERSQTKYEWEAGVIVAMTGGSRAHNRISGELYTALRTAGNQQGCETFMADFKVVSDSVSYYPDVMVTCQPGDDSRFEERPCLVAEVLSPSTERRDRILKWDAYSKIESLKHYLLVHQDSAVIEHHYRTDLGWTTEVVGAGETIQLRCPSITLAIDDLYS